jgi:hypothetical protein
MEPGIIRRVTLSGRLWGVLTGSQKERNSSPSVCRNLCDGLTVWMRAFTFAVNGSWGFGTARNVKGVLQ